MRKMISEKEAQLIKQNAEDIEALQETLDDVSVTEAGALKIDSKLEVADNVDIGDETTADSPKIILHSTPASNQGDWAVYTTGNQQFLYFEQIGQNSGIKISRSSILPGSHNYVSLGNSSFAFKDIVLRGAVDFGSSTNIKLSDGKLQFTASGIIIPNLPTSDPQVAGQLWNDNGVLKVSAGE